MRARVRVEEEGVRLGLLGGQPHGCAAPLPSPLYIGGRGALGPAGQALAWPGQAGSCPQGTPPRVWAAPFLWP